MRKYICLLLTVLVATAGNCQQFSVSYTPAVFKAPFTGRVILYLSKENPNPKTGMVDFEAFPAAAVDVRDIKPGAAVILDDKAFAFPVPLSDMERGDYYVQAVWDRNLGGRAIADCPGNLFSLPVKCPFTRDTARLFTVVCDQLIPQRTFTETKFVKLLQMPSQLLSRALGTFVTVNGAVLLPREYDSQPERKFPVLYIVSGFGGDYHRYSGDTSVSSQPIDTIPCITVYLDGSCSGGHSVYANSDNNGPWGDALTKEFIPLMERHFRCDGARLLQGHSSGGWTVLWLQTQYPAVFAGCWASSPDPVDFRSFQKVNLYADDNMFYTKDGAPQLVATIAGRYPVATMKQCYRQEFVINRGEQMQSFNAVFSPKGAYGRPVPICDPQTGAIDRQCFEHWKRYDICANLRNHWTALQKDLQGKIRVSVGNQDNFLLNFAVHMLDDEMKKLDTHFIFGYYPGDHFTVYTPAYRSDGAAFLAERYRQWKRSLQ